MSAAFPLQIRDNENEAGRRANATRPLTHSLDCTEEGLAMKATRTPTDLERAISLVLATGAKGHHIYAFRVEGEPIAKARVRVDNGRAYAPDRVPDAELQIAETMRRRDSGDGDIDFAGNVAVAAVFYRSNRHRIDVDNLLKTVLDGITKSGLVWEDDYRVTALLGVLEHDPAWPRIAVAIAHHDSTLTRGEDSLTHVCETCSKRYRPHGIEPRGSRYCSWDCRPRRVQICSDCGGPTSAPHVRRCRRCYHASLRSNREVGS